MVSRSIDLRALGRVSVIAIGMVVALALTVLSLVYSSRAKYGLIHTGKNWVLLAISIMGIFAMFQSKSIKAQPRASIVSILLFALLAYISLQDIVDPGFMMSPGTISTPILQLIVLIIFIAPVIVKRLGVKIPTLPGSMSYQPNYR